MRLVDIVESWTGAEPVGGPVNPQKRVGRSPLHRGMRHPPLVYPVEQIAGPSGGGNRGQPERVRDHSWEWIGEKIKERMDRGGGGLEQSIF